jgi:tetratricopeptide (TPR) repeat protein
MNTDIPNRAKQLHAEAREAGGRGEHDNALRLFTEAMALAPHWPYPIYDRAFTHLLMSDNEAALADYRRALELAPRGFFTAFTAVDTLEREQRGELPPGLYLAYCLLEWVDDETQRRSALEQMVAKYPSFAPGWFKLSGLTKDSRERLGMLDRGLAALPDRETGGMLKLNKALLLNELGDQEASAALVREVLADPETPVGVEAWAKTLAGQQ